MKALFLSTSSNETDKYHDCLANLKLGESQIMRYDPLGTTDQILYSKVKEYAPDLVVYIGVRWGQQPSIAALSAINEKIAPMVHICSDAADTPWHDLLREYHNAGAFSLQVAIDGSRKWPMADSQMTALTPVDPAHFPSDLKLHVERTIDAGYAGNPGSGPFSKRTAVLSALLGEKCLDLRIRSNLPYTYEAFCVYLSKVRMSLNIAYTGTEATTHVKGRVLESALAGACLLETKGSPTCLWFRPGIDYLEYESAAEAASIIRNTPSTTTQVIADSLRKRVLAEHSPLQFWSRIFERIGLTMGEEKIPHG
jgi:hypothetical protein